MKTSPDNQTLRLLAAREIDAVSGGTAGTTNPPGSIGEWASGGSGTSHDNRPTSTTISSVRGGEVSGSTSAHEGRFM